MTHSLLEVDDLDPVRLQAILDRAVSWKAEPAEVPAVLTGRGVAALFEKPSARTRISVEMAVATLGGHPIYVRPEEVGLDTRETVEDVARTMAGMCAAIAARVFDHRTLERMEAVVDVPVVNLLSDRAHPCQALADLLTLREHFNRLEGLRVAYVGDGNNVAASLAYGAALSGVELVVASPEGYELDADVVAGARNLGGTVELTGDPDDAVRGVDAVYTDVWTSMGQETERELAAARVRGVHDRRGDDEGREPRRGVPALPARAPRRGGRARGDRRPPLARLAPGRQPDARARARCSSISSETFTDGHARKAATPAPHPARARRTSPCRARPSSCSCSRPRASSRRRRP